MGGKWLGSGSAGNWLHYGSFYFHKAVGFHEITEFPDNLATLEKNFACFGRNNEVNIALPVARLHVLEAMIFFR